MCAHLSNGATFCFVNQMLRSLLFLLAFVLITAPLQAVGWRNDGFGISANLPDSAGWQPQGGDVPGLSVLVMMQNPTRGAVFGITALNNPPNTNLRDPNTLKVIEAMLQRFGYTWAGSATTNINGQEWRQYNVTAGTANGVVRYTSGNGYIFAVTLLVGGREVAAQDVELQSAASSVRLFAPAAPTSVASTTPGAPDAAGKGTPSSAPLPGLPGLSGSDSGGDAPKVESGSFTTLLITGGAALLFIIVLLVVSSRSRR